VYTDTQIIIPYILVKFEENQSRQTRVNRQHIYEL
jgi:hypothetical protein